MKETKMALPSTYQALLKNIHSVVHESKHSIERTAVSMYWTIGKGLETYLEANGRTLRGGISIYDQLSKDLKIDSKTLYESGRFYRVYPKIDEKLGLSWSHYRKLSHIKEDAERKRWERRIINENLSVNKLLMLRQKPQKTQTKSKTSLPVKRGKLYHYRVVKIRNEFFIDCGFNNYIYPKRAGSKLSNTRIYRSVKESGYDLRLSKAVKEEVYTYVVYVQRVIDADTILVNIDCGFGIFHKENLRLRGINAPELKEIAGKRAANTVKNCLSKCSFVIVKTYKEDKYGRRLADVFFSDKRRKSTPDEVVLEGVFLNQKLLDEGLAEIY